MQTFVSVRFDSGAIFAATVLVCPDETTDNGSYTWTMSWT